MKKIFITYGDDAFKRSRERIEKEAKSLKLFDRVIAYTPEDLPSYIKTSVLMRYRRGGGIGAGNLILSMKLLKNMVMIQLLFMRTLDVNCYVLAIGINVLKYFKEKILLLWYFSMKEFLKVRIIY